MNSIPKPASAIIHIHYNDWCFTIIWIVSDNTYRFFTCILLFMIYLATLTVARCVTASNYKMINDLERLWEKLAVEQFESGIRAFRYKRRSGTR